MKNRKKHTSCLGKIFNCISTGVLIVITVCLIQMYSNTEVGAATLKFAQISDSHLSTSKVNKAYRLTASSTALLDDAIDKINSTQNLDFVFFTGDIVDVPFEKNYKLFFRHVSQLKYPYYTVPGNHDICVGGYISKQVYVNLMQKNNKNFKFTKTYFSFTPKAGFKVIGLDTTIDNRITSNGELSQEQLDFLDRELYDSGDNTILIFMHVPMRQPFSSDSHRLLNGNTMNDILKKYSNPIAIFSGHYHTTKVMQQDNIINVSTPALISYPNAFRFVTIKNLKNKTIFEFQYVPTRLTEIQKKSKLLVFHASTYYGNESDRTTTITIERGHEDYDEDK